MFQVILSKNGQSELFGTYTTLEEATAIAEKHHGGYYAASIQPVSRSGMQEQAIAVASTILTMANMPERAGKVALSDNPAEIIYHLSEVISDSVFASCLFYAQSVLRTNNVTRQDECLSKCFRYYGEFRLNPVA